MPVPDPGLHNLARALDLVAAHRRQPAGSDAELLAAHPDLRDLLEPLLAEPTADEFDGADAGDGAGEARTLGDFRLLGELGRGGMGVVFTAVQLSLGRRVALKLLPEQRAASPDALSRFHREAELLARLRHDHLVPVFASGTADGQHFFAMELVPGCSLAAVLNELQGRSPATLQGDTLATALANVLATPDAGARLRGRNHAAAAVGLILPIAEALAYAHAQGVVHRDVKPGNILLRADGTPVLTDFGLARDLAMPSQTQTGDFAGTPHYVAPEQVEGSPAAIDGRADVFALCATLYELLTLRRAFDGPTAQAVLTQVLRGEPQPPRKLGVELAEDLLAVLDRGLRKAPAERYASMAAFAHDLQALLAMRPVSVKRPGPLGRLRRYARREPLKATFAAVLAVGAPVLLGLGGYLLLQQPRIHAAAERERREAAEPWVESGYLELGEGSALQAVQRFRSALEFVPELPEALAGLALAGDRLGQTETVAYARQQLAAHQDLLRALRVETDGEVTTGAPPTALACYVRGMRWLELAHDRGDAATYHEAAAALREAIDRAPVARALYHCQYLHALFHLQEPTAIRAFAKVVQDRWPDAPLARYWVAFALEELEPAQALALQQDVAAARPDLLLPRVAIARLHERAGRLQEAAAEYEAVLAREPDHIDALIGLARTRTNTGDNERAAELARRALALAPRSHMPYLVLGGAQLALEQLDAAAASAERAAAMTPDDEECHLLLARIALARGDSAAALAATTRATQLAPNDSEPHLLAAHAQIGAGQPAAAAASLERVVALEPGRVLAWHDLAWQREALGDDVGAAAAIAEATARGGDRADVQYALGTWHKQRGHPDLAERHLRRAIELDPTLVEARVNLAALLWRLERMPECIAVSRDAVHTAPDSELANEGLARALQRDRQLDAAITERLRWAEAHQDSAVAWLKVAGTALAGDDAALLATALSAVEHAAAVAKEPRADVLYWRAEVLRRRGDTRDVWEPLYREATALPNCSDALKQQIDAVLAGGR